MMRRQNRIWVAGIIIMLSVFMNTFAQTNAARGFWIAAEGPRPVKIHFDSFPVVGCHAVWEGEVKDDKAHGRGAVKLIDDQHQDLGAYIATFENGKPVGKVVLVKNPDNPATLHDCSLGGITWNSVEAKR